MYKNITITLMILTIIVVASVFIARISTVSNTVDTLPLAIFLRSDIAQYTTPDMCYSIINGNVYDLTSLITRHPGGPEDIIAMCGIDGTEIYEDAHGADERAYVSLKKFIVGTIASS